MAEIGKWNGHQFIVSPSLIRGFSGLTIKGESETDEKISAGQKYVIRKNGNPKEISLTVELNGFTGCDVRGEAMQFIDEASNGARGYFYLGGTKLVACELMLTEANVTETQIAYDGTWAMCRVQLTMKQSDIGGASGGGTKKASVKTTSPATDKTTGDAYIRKTPQQFAREIVAQGQRGNVGALANAEIKVNAQIAKDASAAEKKVPAQLGQKIIEGKTKAILTVK